MNSLIVAQALAMGDCYGAYILINTLAETGKL